MKVIAVTLRVDNVSTYREKRDSLDQRWFDFFTRISVVPLLIPNSLIAAKTLLSAYKVDGFLFTGGNSLVKYGGDAPERDETENFLMNFALEKNIPLLGVCRGMQFIQDYFGIPLRQISNHVVSEQKIIFNGKENIVNSYHNWGTYNSISELMVLGTSSDGVIKAIKHIDRKILGIMWHPERINPFRTEDINLFKEFYN